MLWALMLRDSFVLNFRDELDAWKLRCADVIFSERRESRPQQIMPGEELRESNHPRAIHYSSGGKVACWALSWVQWERLICVPSAPKTVMCVLFHEKASQMAPKEQVWNITEGCIHMYVSVCISVCMSASVHVFVSACVWIYVCLRVSICSGVCMPVSVCLYVCLSLCVCPCVCLSVSVYDVGAFVPLCVCECGGELKGGSLTL